jgi:hypothetical protein
MLLRMLLKLVKHFEVLLVNRLVGGGREVNVSFLATTLLVNAVLNLNTHQQDILG